MKNTLKFYLLLSISIFVGCNSDDDNSTLPPTNSVSEFKIDRGKPYLTPNGYYSQYTLGDKKDIFILYFIDGELVPITNPEEGIPCPWVENMTQGITIQFTSSLDNEIATGIYKYSITDEESGVNPNSRAFYGFVSDDNCFSQTDENLDITDGEMTISKEDELFTITYSFISENGKEIKGAYYGKLKKHLDLDW